jgi:hypothetical protein
LGVIAAGIALVIVLTLAIVGFARALWRWIAGGPPEKSVPAPVPASEAAKLDGTVTASDLFAVRSNLNAVARQLEDLEIKLRLHAPRR